MNKNFKLDSNAVIALGIPAALVVTMFLSLPALTGPFVFDDFPNLENLAVLNGQLDWESLANYASLYIGDPGRPLSMLSFVINDFDWPSSPYSFKYTNLMLHLLIGVVVYGFARTLARVRTHNLGQANLAALVVMSAWLLHPMQLSTSMLIVQRMTQLSSLFTLIALWSYATLAVRATRPIIAIAAIAVLGLGTILAVLCKENGALTPLLALVLNATILRKRLQTLPTQSRRTLAFGTILPVAALILALGANFERLTNYGSRPFSMSERMLSEARALSDYLIHILVPSVRGGGVFHDDFEISRSLLTPATTLPSVLLISGLLVGALWGCRRHPIASFGVLWFLGGHLLESSVFPLELYFEHRNYLPMVGILFPLAFWVANANLKWRRLARAGSILWIAFAAWLTSIQAPIWGSQEALVSVWAIEHPQSPRAIQQLAAFEYRNGKDKAAAETLLDAYSRGVRGSDFPLQVLLLACMTQDPAMAKKAQRFLSESLLEGEYSRATPVTARKLRNAIEGARCPKIVTEEEWLALTGELLKNPNFSTGQAGAYLHVERAYVFVHRRNLNDTMFELEQAWHMTPTPEIGQLIAATLSSAGLYELAEDWAKRALQHRPRGIRGWLSNDQDESQLLLDTIRSKMDEPPPERPN